MVSVLGEGDFLPVDRGSRSLEVLLMEVIQYNIVKLFFFCFNFLQQIMNKQIQQMLAGLTFSAIESCCFFLIIWTCIKNIICQFPIS